MLCYAALLIVGFMPIYAQAATAPIKEDTNTDYNNPSTNYGNAQSINVNINKQGFLNFDPSALPNPSTIDKATLFIYVKSVGTAGGLQICPVISPWLENDLTFTTAIPLQNALSCTLSSKIDPKQPALWNPSKPLPDGAFVAVDVTQLVKSGYYNFAVGIDPRYTSTNISFDSKEANQTSHHAYLDIALTNSTTVNDINQQIASLQAQVNDLKNATKYVFAQSTTCPTGYKLIGSIGIIIPNNTPNPFVRGSAFNSSWYWIHPTLCERL
jgi:hypothetical protein